MNNGMALGLIALSSLKGIGPAFIKKVVAEHSFVNDDLYHALHELTSNNGKSFEGSLIMKAIEEAEKIVYRCKMDNIKIVNFYDFQYSESLKELKDLPPVIYCKGNSSLLNKEPVCIIGTREPDAKGAMIAERVGAYYANAGRALCNGLAEGVDTFSVQVDGRMHSRVIGVLAGGLDYNIQKTILKKTAQNAEKVIENDGLLVSEMPPGKKEDTFSVVKSCRIQAGLSSGLVLIQSSLEGGSRFTIKSFCEMHRPLAVICPVQSDFDLFVYSANKNIILNGIDGISLVTGLNKLKINTSEVFVIKSKYDYEIFENIMTRKFNRKSRDNYTLFE